MSKINSFALILIIAVSLSSCGDKSTKALYRTWRIENVKFSKPLPPQVQPMIQEKIEMMKGNDRITYNQDGTFEEVQNGKTIKGTWDYSKRNNCIYSTSDMGSTTKYSLIELVEDKFTYTMPNGPGDSLTFYYVPFSAKDTLNRKPIPQQMQPQQAPPQEGPAAQGGDSSAAKGSK